MKARRVIVTLELDTPATLELLRRKDTWQGFGETVIQVQANVIKPEKGKK